MKIMPRLSVGPRRSGDTSADSRPLSKSTSERTVRLRKALFTSRRSVSLGQIPSSSSAGVRTSGNDNENAAADDKQNEVLERYRGEIDELRKQLQQDEEVRQSVRENTKNIVEEIVAMEATSKRWQEEEKNEANDKKDDALAVENAIQHLDRVIQHVTKNTDVSSVAKSEVDPNQKDDDAYEATPRTNNKKVIHLEFCPTLDILPVPALEGGAAKTGNERGIMRPPSCPGAEAASNQGEDDDTSSGSWHAAGAIKQMEDELSSLASSSIITYHSIESSRHNSAVSAAKDSSAQGIVSELCHIQSLLSSALNKPEETKDDNGDGESENKPKVFGAGIGIALPVPSKDGASCSSVVSSSSSRGRSPYKKCSDYAFLQMQTENYNKMMNSSPEVSSLSPLSSSSTVNTRPASHAKKELSTNVSPLLGYLHGKSPQCRSKGSIRAFSFNEIKEEEDEDASTANSVRTGPKDKSKSLDFGGETEDDSGLQFVSISSLRQKQSSCDMAKARSRLEALQGSASDGNSRNIDIAKLFNNIGCYQFLQEDTIAAARTLCQSMSVLLGIVDPSAAVWSTRCTQQKGFNIKDSRVPDLHRVALSLRRVLLTIFRKDNQKNSSNSNHDDNGSLEFAKNATVVLSNLLQAINISNKSQTELQYVNIKTACLLVKSNAELHIWLGQFRESIANYEILKHLLDQQVCNGPNSVDEEITKEIDSLLKRMWLIYKDVLGDMPSAALCRKWIIENRQRKIQLMNEQQMTVA